MPVFNRLLYPLMVDSWSSTMQVKGSLTVTFSSFSLSQYLRIPAFPFHSKNRSAGFGLRSAFGFDLLMFTFQFRCFVVSPHCAACHQTATGWLTGQSFSQ